MVAPFPTERDLELLHAGAIAANFPIQFPNGAVLERFTGCCAGCDQEIPSKDFRGVVNLAVPSTVVLEAVGLCNCCDVATRFNYRVYDDLSIATSINGRWHRWEHEPGWVERLQRLMGWLRASLSLNNRT